MDRFSEMQIFARVVELGSFSAAARSMSLTPSGVSKLVTRLEDRLQVLLFKRNSRTMTLTPEGQAYYERILVVLEALERAEETVSNPAREMSGVLRIYASLSFAYHRVAPIIPEFQERYPHLKIEIHTGTGPLRSLDSTMDLALYPWDMQDCSLIVRKIAETNWCICASPSYLQKNGSPTSPSELANHVCMNFAMDAPCNNWRVWDRTGKMHVRVTTEGAVSATESELLLALARAGGGIARLPDYIVKPYLASGHLIQLFPEGEKLAAQSIYAIYHSRRHVASRVRTFLAFLEEKFRDENSLTAAPAKKGAPRKTYPTAAVA